MSTQTIAIISDINANTYALNAFLSYINCSHPETIILNLGNFIQNGPYPSEVFDTITRDQRFINILGPDEDELLTQTDEYNDTNPHKDWVLSKLGPDRLNKLRQLPKSQSLTINGQSFLLLHTVYTRNIMFDTTLFVSIIKGGTLEKLEPGDLLGAYDYIACGNRGVQEYYAFTEAAVLPGKAINLISPGDLCYFIDDRISFALLKYEEDHFDISFKTIKCSPVKVIDDLFTLDVPERERILFINYKLENIEAYLENNDILKKHAKTKGSVVIDTRYCVELTGRFGPLYSGFWEKLMSMFIMEAGCIELCCFKNEAEIIDEIISSIDGEAHQKEYGVNQLSIKGKVSDGLVDLVTKRYTDSKGNMKWFELHLRKDWSGNDSILSVIHFGSKYFINDLDTNRLSNLKTILNDKLTYKVY